MIKISIMASTTLTKISFSAAVGDPDLSRGGSSPAEAGLGGGASLCLRSANA